MKDVNKFFSGRHCFFRMRMQCLFLFRCRGRKFENQIYSDLENIFRDVCDKFEADLVEFQGEDNHVSLIIDYPPKTSIPVLVASLKSISSRLIRKKWRDCLPPAMVNGGAFWSRSYLAVSREGIEGDAITKFAKSNSWKLLK